jgi:predicted transcriptional regulator
VSGFPANPSEAATAVTARRLVDRDRESDARPLPGADAAPSTPALATFDDRQWKALASPIRVELLLLADAIEPCSIADLARLSGRRSTGLYRHVAILADADLLLPRGKRPGPRRPEQLYRVNEHFASLRDRCRSDHGGTERFRRLQEAVWRAIDRGLADRLEREGDTSDGPVPGDAVHEVTWLDEAQRGEVDRLLARLREIALEGRRTRTGDLCQLDLVVWRRSTGEGDQP